MIWMTEPGGTRAPSGRRRHCRRGLAQIERERAIQIRQSGCDDVERCRMPRALGSKMRVEHWISFEFDVET